MASPYSIHQQQLASVSQQQSFQTAASKPVGINSTLPGRTNNQTVLNGYLALNVSLPYQNWPNLGYQGPGIMPPASHKGVNISGQVSLLQLSMILILFDNFQFYKLY